MGIQQWWFSFKGRIGRRDFWIWTVICVLVLIMGTMLIDLGAFIGTQGENKFGIDTLEVQFR